MKKKMLLSLFVILLGILTFGAMSASAEASGTCGDNLTWVLNDEGTLTISGQGDMDSWSYASAVPWYSSQSNITKVVVEDGVTSIGDSAFCECFRLTSITIPDSVTSIGEQVFYYCVGLESIYVDADNKNYSSYDGNLYNKNQTTLIQYALGKIDTHFEIPANVTTIDTYVFSYCRNLTSVTIPDGVTNIGSYAFYRCDSLTSVTIPNSVTVIGDYAFFDCSSLTSVTIPNSVTDIGSSAFECSSLTSVIISGSVTIISECAFCDCDSLTSVTIPNSVTKIEVEAFYLCKNLTDVYYNGTEEEWDKISIGSHNEYLTNATIHYTYNPVIALLEYTVSNGEATITDCDTSVSGDIVIPDTLDGYPVTSIGNSAFRYCSGLTSITVPDDVTAIGNYAFMNCSALTSVVLPDGITEIGDGLFGDCTSLSDVTIPDSVTAIGDNAFKNCVSLTDIAIPDSISVIDDATFLGCTGLTNVTIPDGITRIGSSAFALCSRLKSVAIADSVVVIGGSAFYSCESLTDITIPEGVTYLGSSAFFGCKNIKSITIPGRITYLESGTFDGCTGLTSVTIPYGIVAIEGGAFGGCTGLTDVTIADSVIRIEQGAFEGCTGLTDVTIPDSVTEIYELAFWKCTGLKRITMGDGVTRIRENAFQDCSSLTYVVLPEKLNRIEKGAFSGCSNIDLVFYTGSAAQWEAISFDSDNECLTNATIVYNAEEKTYHFVTNCEAKLPDITDYAVFTMPTVDNPGMILQGWYPNEALDEAPVAFPYYGDETTLYADWEKEYVDYRINGISVRDLSGNVVETIPDGIFLATISFTNVSASEDTVIVLAQYTAQNAFHGLMYVSTKDVPVGSTIELTLPVDNSDGDVAKLKAFCWESFASMKPMGNSAEILK